MEVEDDQRNSLLQMQPRQLRDVARFCNAYPSMSLCILPSSVAQMGIGIDVSHKVDEMAGDPVLSVTIERDVDEDDETDQDYAVVAPLYPSSKTESWWAVVTEPATKTLVSVKKFVLQTRHNVKLALTLPPGPHDLSLTIVSDSYVGADREFEVHVDIPEGAEDASSDEDSDQEMSE